MSRRLVVLVCLCALPLCARAQDSTAARLLQARDLYERLDLERALPLLREVVSPNWPFEVTAPQRVEANIYLGATHMLLGARDSAVAYFRAALERAVFAVGVRPVTPTRLDPRTGRVTFTIVATHAASVRCEIRLGPPSPQQAIV